MQPTGFCNLPMIDPVMVMGDKVRPPINFTSLILDQSSTCLSSCIVVLFISSIAAAGIIEEAKKMTITVPCNDLFWGHIGSVISF